MLNLPGKIKAPSEISKNYKKGDDELTEIRAEPETLAEFEALTWAEKSRLKQDNPVLYWQFIEQIKRKECD